MTKDTTTAATTADPARHEADARLDRALGRAGIFRGRPAAPSAQAKGNAGRWLALVPVATLVVGAALSLPRATSPEDVPLPRVDGAALARAADADRALAAAVAHEPLPRDVRALGSELRAFRALERSDTADVPAVAAARGRLDALLAPLLAEGRGRDLLRLRAVQLEAFLVELAAFERTGAPSDELLALSGRLVERLRDAGWVEGRKVVLDDGARRALFKKGWAATLGLDRAAGFALALDEERALYTVYLDRPHPPEAVRRSYEALRAEGDAARAEALRADVEASAELWRHEKVRELARIDPTYPEGYARGVALYRARRWEASARAFGGWLDEHPDGPYAQRARNHLAAALRAGAIE